MIGTILGNVYVIRLGIDVGIELGSLDIIFDDSNDGKLEGFFPGEPLESTDGKVLGFYTVINLGSTDGKVLGTILGNAYEMTLGIDIGTELVSLDCIL